MVDRNPLICQESQYMLGVTPLFLFFSEQTFFSGAGARASNVSGIRTNDPTPALFCALKQSQAAAEDKGRGPIL